MRNLANYAATSVSCSSDRPTMIPFSNFTPTRTSVASWGALTARHRVWADSISLKVPTRPAAREIEAS